MRKITLHKDTDHSEQTKSKVTIKYVDENIALCDDVRNICQMRGTALVECFLILLVKEGHATVKIENTVFDIGPKNLFVCTPRNIIDDSMMSADFCSLTIIISPDYIRKIATHTNVMNVSVDLMKAKHQIAKLTDDEENMIIGYFNMLSTKFNMPPNKFKTESVLLLLKGLAYECTAIIAKSMNINELAGFSSAETIFHSFMQTLHMEKECYKSVNAYANHLNITPKYFSFICKQISGKTASELIDEEVVERAKILLRNPQYSIKEVAKDLGFTNQSHFGSFMRKKAGASPQFFRKREDNN